MTQRLLSLITVLLLVLSAVVFIRWLYRETKVAVEPSHRQVLTNVYVVIVSIVIVMWWWGWTIFLDKYLNKSYFWVAIVIPMLFFYFDNNRFQDFLQV